MVCFIPVAWLPTCASLDVQIRGSSEHPYMQRGTRASGGSQAHGPVCAELQQTSSADTGRILREFFTAQAQRARGTRGHGYRCGKMQSRWGNAVER